jgi:subtilisin family serine protease
MYATAVIPRHRPLAARPTGWWLLLLFAMASLCAASVPAVFGVQFAAPPRAASIPIVRKAVGPLSARLAALAEAGGMSANQAATMRALSLPEHGPGSLLADAAGDPLVYIRLAQVDARSRSALSAAGARIIHASARYGMITALVAPRQLAAVAAVPGVVSMHEALAPMVQPPVGSSARPAVALAAPKPSPACPAGSVVSEGDTQLRAARARERFGVDGSGVTVGVLSGSYDVETATQLNAADDIAAGDLPGTGNPCGYTTPVQVLAESRVGVGRDEGRAMLQIVHDMAPRAALAFATASDGLYAFADNIRRLRGAGRADIIVDDYYYPEEPFFQDGPINVAIRDVVQDGAIYVTAGGNINVTDSSGRPIGSYEAPAYRPSACPTLKDAGGNAVIPGVDCHDFDAGDDVNPRIGMTLPAGGLIVLNFQWSESWFGVATDLDIFLVDEQNNLLAQSINGLGPSPFELLGYSNATDAPQKLYLIVGRTSGATPRLKFVIGSAALAAPPISWLEYADMRSIDTFGPTTTDHALSADAITVGAAPYNDAHRTAPFSSHGPATVYWAPVESIRAAPPLPEPSVRAKPDVIATTGARTTFYGRIMLGGPRCNPSESADAVCRFFGTSAAAPHAAGVLALVKQQAYQRDVALDQGQARQLLAQSAQWMRGLQDVRGAGLIDAVGAVAAVAQLPMRVAAMPAQFQMPELFDLTEMQAREILLRLGVPAERIVSDYQDRGKLGDLFERVAPFHVVSSLPHSGEIVNPGATVVLGVRAPEPLPAPK